MSWLLSPLNKIIIGMVLVLGLVATIFTKGVQHEKGRQARFEVKEIKKITRKKKHVQNRIDSYDNDAVVKQLRSKWTRK